MKTETFSDFKYKYVLEMVNCHFIKIKWLAYRLINTKL